MALFAPLVERFLCSGLLQTWNVTGRLLRVRQISSIIQFYFFENDFGGRRGASDAAASEDEGRAKAFLGSRSRL